MTWHGKRKHPHCDAMIFSSARPSVAPLDCARAHERFEEKIQIENASYLQPAPTRSTSGGANLERTAPASRPQLPPRFILFVLGQKDGQQPLHAGWTA